MKIKRQNKLGTYLAVTVGAGCATSVADGALVVLDLSGIDVKSSKNIDIGNDGYVDVVYSSHAGDGTGIYYGSFQDNPWDATVGVGNSGTTYQNDDNASMDLEFSSNTMVRWSNGPGVNETGAVVGGDNWISFKDSQNRIGWLNYSLESLGKNNSGTAGFGLKYFVYEDEYSLPSDAPTLSSAVTAVPEPSSIALLALGSAGLLARRQRKRVA